MACLREQMRLRCENEGNLTEEARLELKKAREEMACGEFTTHEGIMAKYG